RRLAFTPPHLASPEARPPESQDRSGRGLPTRRRRGLDGSGRGRAGRGMSDEWWDRPSSPSNPRTLSTDLAGINEAMWYLRRSRYEILTYVIDGRLELVGHRADMFRAPDLRAMRDRLALETKGVVRPA